MSAEFCTKPSSGAVGTGVEQLQADLLSKRKEKRTESSQPNPTAIAIGVFMFCDREWKRVREDFWLFRVGDNGGGLSVERASTSPLFRRREVRNSKRRLSLPRKNEI
jgi:hypothetical protein